MNFVKSDNRLTAKKILPPGLFVAALILLALSPLYASAYSTVLINTIMVYIVLAVSWSMFSGPTGYVSLASAAFYGVGIYVSALLGRDLPLPMLMLIGGGASFVLAFIVGAITLRLRGVYFTIFTFALIELMKNLVLWYETTFSGTRGRTVVSVDTQVVFYCLFAMLVIVLLAAFFIKRTRFGMAMTGIGECEDAAAHVGINTTLVKVLAFAGTSFAMGAVGAAKATTMIYIDPPIAFNMLMSFMPVLMVIFGGANSFVGPIIGAVIITLLQEKLITQYPQWYMIAFGAVMILVILFLPSGLMGIPRQIRKALKGAKVNEDS